MNQAVADQAEVNRLIAQFDPESSFRRLVGVSAGIVTVIAVALYGMFGPHLPGGLAHRGYNVPRIVVHVYKGTEGI